MAILKRGVRKQRRNRVGVETRYRSICRAENHVRPFRETRIVAVEHRSRHKRLSSNHSQAIDFREDLCVIGQIVELCSAVRLSVFVRLHVEGEVKQFILETIKELAITAR
jgi:hypothetical protein